MSNETQDNQTRGRGRGFRRPNYRSRSVQSRVRKNLQEEERQIELNKTIRKDSAPKPNQSAISKVIEKGKSLVDSFFNGITPTTRGNIQIQIDDRLSDRISDAYLTRFDQYIYESKQDTHKSKNDINYEEDLFSSFMGAMNIGLAIKLATAADSDQRIYLGGMDALKESKITLPNKASTLLDCVGMTDLKDDNKIRIPNQALAAKRQAVRGLFRIYGKNHLAKLIRDPNDIDEFHTRATSDEWVHGMIDSRLHSIERIKNHSKWQFIEKTKANFTFEYNLGTPTQKKYSFKLPSFDFDKAKLGDIKMYFSNSIFDDFKFDQVEALRICALLVLQLVEKPWLNKLNDKISVVAGSKIHDLIDDFTLEQILNESGIWNVNKYISDVDLNDTIASAIHEWNDGYARELNNFLNVSQINFTKFGSEAQLVEIEHKYVSMENNFLGFRTGKLDKMTKSTTKLKLSSSDAMLGVACRFTQSVDINSEFNISHKSSNFSILRQYVANDFK